MNNRPPPPPPQPPPLPRHDPYRQAGDRIEPGFGGSGPRNGGFAPPPQGGHGGRPPPSSHGGRGGPPSGRRGGGPLKWLLYGVAGIAALVAIGIGIILFALPTDFIRDQIVAQVKARTGRDLVIAGPTSFTVYPAIGLRLSDVSLSARPGMQAKPLVTMASLDASVKLLPLLDKEIELERLVLREPVFELTVDGEGRKSWDFAANGAPVRLAQAEVPTPDAAAPTVTDAPASPAAVGAPPAAVAASSAALEKLSLADVRIDNGILRYSDLRSGAVQEARAINLQMALPSIREPLEATGDLEWKGEKIGLNGRLTTLKDVIDKAPAKLVFKATSVPLIAKFDGAFVMREAAEAEGVVTASSPSVRALAAWLGTALPSAPGYGPLEAAGQLKVQGSTIELAGLDALLDGTKITGGAGADTTGARPNVKANLKLSELDLNKYLGASAAARKAAAPAPAPAGDSGGKAPAESIEELLDAAPATAPATPGPKVQGFVQRAGLSAEPIDTSAIGALDAEVTLETDRILYDKFRFDRTKASLAIANRVVKLTLHEFIAYEGRTTGFVTADATNPATLVVGVNLDAANVAMAPLLKAAGVLDAVTGTARLSAAIAMTGQGTSQLAIAETLKGTADVGAGGGNLKYTSGGETHQLAAVDMKVGVTSLTGPLTAKGGVTWNGEPVTLNATLSTLKELADARPVKIVASVAGKPVTASYDGTLAMGGALSANGTLTAKTGSVRTLAKWLGTTLPPARGFGPLELNGQVAVAQNSYALSNAKLAIDGETATGNLAVTTGGVRPRVSTSLKISALDLNKYMNPAGAPPPRPSSSAQPAVAAPKPALAPAAAAKPPAAKPAQAKPATAKPISATGSTAAPKPATVKTQPFPPPSKLGGPAFAQEAAGWSQEPFNLAALGAIDLDAKLQLGRLIYQNFTVNQSKIGVALKDRVLKTDFEEVQLYQGRGKGVISIDGTKDQMAGIAANLAFDNVEVLPLLKDASDLDMLAGKGTVAVNVTSKGKSQKAVVDNLDGKADLKILDGAIVGINIPGMFRSVTTGSFGNFKSAPTEKTDFSEMSSTWAIASGVATNKDLVLSSPLLRVNGEGKVMLGARRIDYLLKPKVVANLAGQGGDQKLAGVEIPVKITGSFERPKYTPDFKEVLKNPGQFLEQFKDVGKQFKGKDAADIVKGILGGAQGKEAQPQNAAPANGTAQPAPQPAQPQKVTPKQLLDQFLKQ